MAGVNRFGPGCKCCKTSTSPPVTCKDNTACFSFTPYCTAAILNSLISLDFVPDAGGEPTSIAGSGTYGNGVNSRQLCLRFIGDGVIRWTITSDNYLTQTGSTRVTACGVVPATDLHLFPKKFTLFAQGCFLAATATSASIIASGGGISGGCTTSSLAGGVTDGCDVGATFPTHGSVPPSAYFPPAGDIVSCEIDAAAPTTGVVTITGAAARHKMQSNFYGVTDGHCCGTVELAAADGYTCCMYNCIPVKNSRILSTPLGDFPFDTGGADDAFFSATLDVLGIPYQVDDRPGPLFGCQYGCLVREPAKVPVTFYFQVPCDSSSVTIGYAGCTYLADPDCPNDLIAQQDRTDICENEVVGPVGTGTVAVIMGERSCPPGRLASGSAGCNRYWAGSFSIREA